MNSDKQPLTSVFMVIGGVQQEQIMTELNIFRIYEMLIKYSSDIVYGKFVQDENQDKMTDFYPNSSEICNSISI